MPLKHYDNYYYYVALVQHNNNNYYNVLMALPVLKCKQ